ncbi:MAG TPA: hypothetical protein RMH85_32655 [Polyangiaceae bacterium LLY-WYZ-15_(1-7)]|nr:hypothetical protein [Polyangiaceae bacterium LLY-WYZ-15_(1-7)]HJL02198.1 hypothetical protein [Polyangiaceae bacterium LLY-WYZ-15_(1-7)]HJL13278.1 hypothetical protein [Polyangiaceae bacterium LLY-WYZ-15_(1-7)]HJL25389.1 hypothetical protein [Polyangiaceae bacterium LLY-WYZ-15_(1-7)]HJL29027.1 hypothetical protein [Polyangiaceae bacterium LLY-WYZ-15_(1-7)]
MSFDDSIQQLPEPIRAKARELYAELREKGLDPAEAEEQTVKQAHKWMDERAPSRD